MVQYHSMPSFALKYAKVSHMGNRVSHAKNRSKHAFMRNLHTVTVVIDGIKQRMRVPSRVLRQLRAEGVTTHYKKKVN